MLLEVVLPQGQGAWVFMCPSHQCWCLGICGSKKISDEVMQGLKVGVGWDALSNHTAGRGLVSDACLTPLPGPRPSVGLSSLHPFCITSVLRSCSGLSLNWDILHSPDQGASLLTMAPAWFCLFGICQLRTELTAGHSKLHRSGPSTMGAARH